MGAAPAPETDAETARRSDSVAACSIPEENTLLSHSRCCFTLPCFPSRRRSSSFSSSSSSPASPSSSPWWENSWLAGGIQAVKKVREWSEIVAGPKWKTFIRRFNRKGAIGNSNNNRHGKFQYDPLSYALNFDEGQHMDFEDYDDYGNPVGGGGFRDFSSRYASVSVSGKPLNMDARVIDESSAAVV
ncbi:unnamed protein product [Linum tenue]|uniref:Uncharacterized protein n=1 Tax=Linum tenue TaxID=586396 RepID=A0AAV0IR49_9ROSI|nr:unnamed protein product [Linum tenue]